MEIGSFIELQFPKGLEFYKGDTNIARLNTARAAIWHSFRLTGCETIWIPYYQCDSVRTFLNRKNVHIKNYHIDNRFNPIDLKPMENEAVLLVNYYGVMSQDRMRNLALSFNNAIIDNSQAFFCKPINGCYNVYSCRKFIGVPDGAYAIGFGAEKKVLEYEQGFSSDSSLFLLQRIEYGCEGKAYKSRQLNEQRLEFEDCLQMSKLTRTILDGTDYDLIQNRRKENFQIACEFFGGVNSIDASLYYDEDTVPMVYPLVVEDAELINRLQAAKHFQGHWWSYLCDEIKEESFEKWISRYIIPITIDQRYEKSTLRTAFQEYLTMIR